MAVPLSVVVFTYNEEKNLPDCLESLKGLDCELFVVDSGSTDQTVNIASRYGAKVFVHPWQTGPKQWNWALRNLPFSSEWALWMDCDQRLTPELKEEINNLFGKVDSKPGEKDSGFIRRPIVEGVDGFYIKRRQVFRGKWIKHGGYYPKYLFKLVRHAGAWCDEKEIMDVRLYVGGQTAFLRHDLIEDNQNESDIMFFILKHCRFAKLQAEEEFTRRRDGMGWNVRPSLVGTPDQRILWLKNIWYRMPLYVRPFLYFFYLYFLRLGFLDGKQAFLFHFFRGFWCRLLVDVILDDLRHGQRYLEPPD